MSMFWNKYDTVFSNYKLWIIISKLFRITSGNYNFYFHNVLFFTSTTFFEPSFTFVAFFTSKTFLFTSKTLFKFSNFAFISTTFPLFYFQKLFFLLIFSTSSFSRHSREHAQVSMTTHQALPLIELIFEESYSTLIVWVINISSMDQSDLGNI